MAPRLRPDRDAHAVRGRVIVSERDEYIWREYVTMVNYAHARTPESVPKPRKSWGGVRMLGDLLKALQDAKSPPVENRGD